MGHCICGSRLHPLSCSGYVAAILVRAIFLLIVPLAFTEPSHFVLSDRLFILMSRDSSVNKVTGCLLVGRDFVPVRARRSPVTTSRPVLEPIWIGTEGSFPV